MVRILSFDLGFRKMGVFFADFTDSTTATNTPDIIYWATDCVCTATAPSISELVDATVRYVSGNEWMYTMPDIVVLEQQMETNPKMRAMANALQASITSLAWHVGHKELYVRHVAPRLKYSKFRQFCVWPTKSYTERKHNSVRIADAIVAKWNLTDKFQKVNYDMADALGNACAFIFV